MTYAIQDGPDFYLFDGDSEEPAEVINSPFPYNDGDPATAQAARDWFCALHPAMAIQTA